MAHPTWHLKVISYLLSLLLILQSCTVYQSHQYSANDASAYENTNIKVTTIDGNKYLFRWVDEEDGNLISIQNTKVEYLKKAEIETVILNNPFTYSTLEEALNQDGPVFIRTKGFKVKNELYNYEFLRMQDRGDRVRGITRTNNNIETVILPIEIVREIKVQNKGASTAATIGSVLGIVLLIGGIYGISEMSKGDWLQMSFD